MFKKKPVVTDRPMSLHERADSASAVAGYAIHQFEVAILDLEGSADEHDLVAQVALADADKIEADADFESDRIEYEAEFLAISVLTDASAKADSIYAEMEARVTSLLETSHAEAAQLTALAEFAEEQAQSSREAAQKIRSLIGLAADEPVVDFFDEIEVPA